MHIATLATALATTLATTLATVLGTLPQIFPWKVRPYKSYERLCYALDSGMLLSQADIDLTI